MYSMQGTGQMVGRRTHMHMHTCGVALVQGIGEDDTHARGVVLGCGEEDTHIYILLYNNYIYYIY